MKTMKKVTYGVTLAAAAAAIVVGVMGSMASAAPRCICPLYYAPVRCDNGRTYSNQCFANCARATGCVPMGPGPIDLQ